MTDWLDGYLARRMNLSSPLGAFLDPVADKVRRLEGGLREGGRVLSRKGCLSRCLPPSRDRSG